MGTMSKVWSKRVGRRTVLKAGVGGVTGATFKGTGLDAAAAVASVGQPLTVPAGAAVVSAGSAVRGLTLSLTTQAVGVASVLVLIDGSTGNPYGSYLGEILRAEGIRDYEVRSLSTLSSGLLAGRAVVVLGECAPDSSQIAMLDSFVTNGGGLVAMRPAAGLGPLCGVSSQSGTTSDAYMRITDASLGAGLYSDSMQFHGVANHYGLVGASQVAQLYSSRASSMSFPAATFAPRGAGRAAAFAYDLAKSVVLTRQGNPANANVDVDQDGYFRSVDLYNGWIDRERSSAPQADMQQRLLARLIEAVSPLPTPHLWYFPNTRPAVFVPTGDSHANPQSYYQALVDAFRQRGIGMTIYLAPSAPSASVIAGWKAQGFDFAPHPYVDSGYQSGYNSSFPTFISRYGFTPRTVRTHMVRWQGWADAASIESQFGVEMDFNSYQWGTWLNGAGGPARGYINGSGQPMRFVTSSGSVLPIYQQHTNLVDEELAPEVGKAGVSLEAAIAISRQTIDESVNGYHGVIATQFHVDYFQWGSVNPWVLQTTDYALQQGLQALTADAWLAFVKQRDATSISNAVWSNNTLTFDVAAGGANQTLLLPTQFRGANLTGLQVNGSPANYTGFTTNGRAYAAVAAGTGSYAATYAADVTAPALSGVSAGPGPTNAVVSWTTDELSSSVVDYGLGGVINQQASSPGLTTSHSVTLTGLQPNSDYSYRASSTDAAQNTGQSPTLTFRTSQLAGPTLATVSPTSGSQGTAQTLTLGGSNFVSGATVLLGSTQLAGVVFVNSSAVQAVVPADVPAGVYGVTVRNPDGQTATKTNAYTVLAAPPTLQGVAPTSALPGQTITLTGANFAGGAATSIGAAPAPTTVQNAAKATATVPSSLAPATYDVTLTNPDGQSSTLSGALTIATLPSVGHTTVSDFSGGTLTGASAISGGAAGDGAVVLAATGWSETFPGALDPTRWASGLWQADGSVTVTQGSCAISGGWIRSADTLVSGSVTARLTFAGTAFQNFGLSRVDTLDNPWFLFGVPGFYTANVYARYNFGSTSGDVKLPGFLGAPQEFTIQYQLGSVRFLINGQLVHQVSMGSFNPALALWLSVGQTGQPLVANSASLATYNSSGSLLSAPLDAGVVANWRSFTLQQTTPANTGTQVRVRSSSNGSTWSGWSPFSAAVPFDLALPSGRFLQYELQLTTADSTITPLVASTTAFYEAASGPVVASVVVTPSSTALSPGGTQQFSASALDNQGQPVSGATVTWSVVNGGTIDASGLFTAGPTPGVYSGAVVASSNGVTGTASVTVNASAPTVTAIAPTSGPAAGGTNVTVTGTNFTTGATVTIGGVAATNVAIVSSTQITATTAARPAGQSDVVVTNPGNLSATLVNGFTFVAPPTLLGVAPTTALTGQSITISGGGFASGASVTIGGANGNATIQSATTGTATVPSGLAPGVYDVTLTNPDGQSSTLRAGLTVSGQPSVGHTTAADFAAGTLTNTQVLSGGLAGDGAVALASSGWSDSFQSPPLDPGRWANGLWQADGSVSVTPGVCAITGGWIRSVDTMTNGAVTARLTFGPSAFQNFGLSRSDALDDPWLLFGIPGSDTSSVYVRYNVGSLVNNIRLDGLVGAPHTYTIQYGPGAARFLVDGATVYQLATGAFNAGMAIWLSAGQTGQPLTANLVELASYSSGGSLVSAPFDAGSTADWTSFSAQQLAPNGTTTQSRARTSSDGVTWSGWSPSSASYPFDLALPPGRFLQYELQLASTDATTTPLITATTAFYRPSVATVTIEPASAALEAGATQQFAARVFDSAGRPVTDAQVAWTATQASGSITAAGLFTAGSAPGVYDAAVVATSGAVSGSASVSVRAKPPSIAAVSPSAGPMAGGTSVTITGADFAAGASVQFGGAAATSVNVASATSIVATTPAFAAGVVDVVVTNSDGQSATRPGGFTYVGPPAVTAISPVAGPTGGNTVVTVSGSGFTGATGVTFGASNARSFTVTSDTTLTATSSAQTAGTVDIVVTTPYGASQLSPADQFTYQAQPAVTAVSPAEGPTAGGTVVTVTGSGFSRASAITFGSTAAPSFRVDSDTSLSVTAPARGAGTIDIRVTTPGGRSAAVAADRFTYRALPRVTAVSPQSGPRAGGTTVTISGNNFNGVSVVTFGSTPATSFTVLSATSISAVSPASATTGIVDIRVQSAGGTSAIRTADRFTYT